MGEEVSVDLERGKTLIIKLTAVGELEAIVRGQGDDSRVGGPELQKRVQKILV